MGATLGGAYGLILRLLVPSLNIGPAAFAVVGMAGVVGGSTAAAVTAIVMIFEMTLDYRVVVPMTLTVAISYGVRRALVRDSIYTRKLVLRGHIVPEALQANMHLTRAAKSLMDTNVGLIPASQTLEECRLRADSDQRVPWLLVEEDNQIVGVIAKGQVSETGSCREGTVGEIARRDFCACSEEIPLGKLCELMRDRNAYFALVSVNGRISRDAVRGLVTKARISDAVAEAIEAFDE
jgi:CIC family chloride channel protein